MVKIRLKRMGSKKRPFYRLIATDSRMPRDGRFIETLGYYNPITTPADIHVDEEAVFKWFKRGAVATTSAASLLRREGYLQKWELMKQGVTGSELETRVEAIRNQRRAALEQTEKKKAARKSAKAIAKDAADKEAQATAAEKPAEEAPASKAAAEPAETSETAETPEAAEAPAETAETDADAGEEPKEG